MRGRPPRSLALPLAAALLLLTAGPAAAQETTIPTTPIPEPGTPGQPPISSPAQPLGHAVGDAGAALGVLRLLPEAVQTGAILPGMGDELPKQALAEAGLGLSSAQANSEAYLAFERSIAQASPAGLSVAGNAPQAPGSLVQTALPDNAEPVTGGFNGPENPLLNVGLLNGSAHARWSETLGPCVGTIADATTSLASLSAVNVIPTIPGADQITGPLKEGLDLLPAPLNSVTNLGGLLGGGAAPADDGAGSLLSMPNTMSSRSTVRLVDLPDSERKAVESTSTLQAADINLFKGTPLATSIKVASQPTLRVTSTGSADTSKVEYAAPVLTLELPGREPITLDATNPTADIPIGIPLPTLGEIPGFEGFQKLPVLGDLASLGEGIFKPLTDLAQSRVLDIGVLKLSIAALDEKSMDMTDPFKGLQLGASARLLDLQVLPTNALKDALPEAVRGQLPSSLVQLSLGEQIARAYAPEGGVECGTAPTVPPGGGEQAPGVPDKLAQTSAAYSSVPIFWTGTALLLIGAVIVAALPGRRREADGATANITPSPRPRD